MWDLPGRGLEPRVPCIGRRILNHCTTREVPARAWAHSVHSYLRVFKYSPTPSLLGTCCDGRDEFVLESLSLSGVVLPGKVTCHRNTVGCFLSRFPNMCLPHSMRPIRSRFSFLADQERWDDTTPFFFGRNISSKSNDLPCCLLFPCESSIQSSELIRKSLNTAGQAIK